MLMGIFSQLTRQHREAIIILQIGTFLEFFDLMLYVHMAVLLEELFFPKLNTYLDNLIPKIAFCSTFIFCPIGAIIFGYIGDNFGRKPTVIITTTIMAICCITMANLPIYAEIGVTASWLLIICRIFQGISSLGETVAAQIYLTELIKRPLQFPIVSYMECASVLGTTAAILVAMWSFALRLNWRVVFWIGALIATIGMVARHALRETPNFINAKMRLKNSLDHANLNGDRILETDVMVNQRVSKKTSLYYFLIRCSAPVWLYFSYIYCSGILKNSFHYSPQEVIQNNLIVIILEFIAMLFYAHLGYKVYPMKIIKIRAYLFFIFILFIPYLLKNITNPKQICLIQIIIAFLQATPVPGSSIFFIHFPIFKRFTYVGFLYASARGLIYLISSFAFTYLTNLFNYYGLLIIFIPVLLGFIFGIFHFQKLEKIAQNDLNN